MRNFLKTKKKTRVSESGHGEGKEFNREIFQDQKYAGSRLFIWFVFLSYILNCIWGKMSFFVVPLEENYG